MEAGGQHRWTQCKWKQVVSIGGHSASDVTQVVSIGGHIASGVTQVVNIGGHSASGSRWSA